MRHTKNNPFTIAAAPQSSGQGLGQPVEEIDPTADPVDRVRSMVGSSQVFLLIKGTPQRPLCGFSANTVAIIESLGVPYRTFDVLSDEAIRKAAKSFAGWPTFPQVFIRGELIGGNDILVEMHEAGELRQLVAGVGA